MGIIGALVLIVVILIAGVIVWSFLSTSVVDLVGAGQELLDALKIDIKPQTGEEVCDISITIRSELRDTLLSGTIVAVGGDAGNPRTYQWFDCHQSTSVPFFSLINSNQVGIGNLETLTQPLAFTFGESIDMQVVLIDQSGQRRASPIKSITFGAGFIDTPFQITKTFVYDNLPHRNYELQIFYNNPSIHINDQPTGSPFISNVCKSGLASC
jgi:hypothetical protein